MKIGNGIYRVSIEKWRKCSLKGLLYCVFFLIICEGIELGNWKIWNLVEMRRIEEKKRIDGVRYMNVVYLKNEVFIWLFLFFV